MNLRLLLLLVLSIFLLSGCEQDTDDSAHLGEISFSVTGKEAAQPLFTEGLLLLHSFEYEDAKEAFVKAQELDPTFAMAYWGEAMTYTHPLWSQQDLEKGQGALNRLDSLAGKTSISELEKDFIAAAKVLYGEGPQQEREEAYAEKMGILHQKYSKNHEVAAFYALSLLGSVPMGRDEAIYGKGAAIAKSIIAENPNHPGALHYLIHSYDDPDHATMALEAANRYSKVAPDAAHALHMPSHIYVAMGMWDEVIASNVASYEASLSRMDRKDLGYGARSYHAYAWLMYGYLQKGQIEEAEKIMTNMDVHVENDSSERARMYYVDMIGTFLAATGNWNNKWAGLDINTNGMNIVYRSQIGFTRGMNAFQKEDEKKLSEIIDAMESDRHASKLLVEDQSLAVCGTSYGGPPNQLKIDKAQIMEWQLRAQLSQLQKNPTDAEAYYQKATELEGSISHSFGPPEIFKPSWELYGEWLLDQNRPEEALAQFKQAYEFAPRRLLILNGMLKSNQLLENSSQADSLQQVIDEIKFVAQDAPVLSMN